MAKVEKRPRQGEASNDAERLPIQDLREWLARVEDIGELIHVKQSVDWNEEMSAISYLVAKQNPSPAILFENASGYENSPIGARLLWNILGPSLKRIALTLEESPDTSTLDLIRKVKDKLKQRIPPREISPSQAWERGRFISTVSSYLFSIKMQNKQTHDKSGPL